MKVLTLFLAMMFNGVLALGASVVVNPDGTQLITGAVEQFLPNENTASVKIKDLRKVLLIPNLLQLAESKISLLQSSLDTGAEVKLKVSPANKILDVLP